MHKAIVISPPLIAYMGKYAFIQAYFFVVGAASKVGLPRFLSFILC